MPSGSFWQVYVKCPFFKYDNGESRITCEGLVDRSSVILSYKIKADYKMQISEYCCKHYDKCEIYSALKSKYE